MVFNQLKRWGMLILMSWIGLMSAVPQSAETQTIYLSGKGADDAVNWDFFCTDGRKSHQWSTIKVPSCWEQEGFGEYGYGVNFYGKKSDPLIASEKGEYRHQFDVSSQWRGKRIYIVFEGVMTDAEVRINGKKVGTHHGAFYRFKYDITNYVKFGKSNQLSVLVSKESDNISVNMAERRGDYWNFGGIFRPVYLEIMPPCFIDWVAVSAQADGTCSARVFLSQGVSGDFSVKAQLLDSNDKIIGASFFSEVAEGSDQVNLNSKFTGIRQWTAETPNLYQIRFSLFKNDQLLHQKTERIGFRTFEIRKGDGLYLNGSRIMMKGINRHSFWPETGRTLNRKLNYDDVQLIKEMNMNAVRMSHYPPDVDFLNACDELGLYVIDELGGWHGYYDTGIGRKLVREMVTRDVNHASVLLWSNGNEGGWNTDLDTEFGKYDLQNRPVIHPQQELNGLETMHYRSYGQTQEYLRGQDLFMPTEFLHGLYDGGHGAGLFDYWEMMRLHPNCAGGFLWAFADEGVARTDQNNRIDNDGNHGADGIVGPHHEKEGSFYTVREVWSPVCIYPKNEMSQEECVFVFDNRYDFINLKSCEFSYRLEQFPAIQDNYKSGVVLANGKIESPDVAPGTNGEIKLLLPEKAKEANVLYVTATDPYGAEIWTWSFALKRVGLVPAEVAKGAFETIRDDSLLVVKAGASTCFFDTTTGYLSGVEVEGKPVSFGNGPRFVAARRGDRSLDGWIEENLPEQVNRIYPEIVVNTQLKHFSFSQTDSCVIVEAEYAGALQKTKWSVFSNGALRLEYDYRYDGIVELMGVRFDYPESRMVSIRYLGQGPYRVWQNRLRGTTLGIWENNYNDAIPGESFIYPEFKGYFRDWQWAVFSTTEGDIAIGNEGGTPYLGVYTPRDGRDALLYTLPETGISFLDVIPAVRNKVNNTDLIGPSSQAAKVAGIQHGSVMFIFLTCCYEEIDWFILYHCLINIWS